MHARTGMPHGHARRGRLATAGLALALVAATLTGCTAGRPDPAPVARALAEAIADGDLSGVPLGGVGAAEATAALTAAFEGLGTLPSVEVGEVGEPVEPTAAPAEGEPAATADVELAFSWDLGAAEPWTYTTPAHLDLVDDAWRVRWSTFLLAPDLREVEVLATHRVAAERADVLGPGGTVLVTARPVQRLGLDKTLLPAEEWDGAARGIASALGLDPEPYAARAAAMGEKAFVEALVVRTENPGDVDLLGFADLPGARAVADTLPLAPTRRFARPVLGTAGPATAEIIEASDGAVVEGDLAGLSGLQEQYDAQLRGTPGLTVVARAADNDQERVLFSVEPVRGDPLQLTLDVTWQEAAEQVLEPVGPASAIVALRASTGEVLAVASGSGGEGYSTATLGTYAPGSVFKIASTLALLRAGLTPDSAVDCPASTTVDGRTFENFPGYPARANGSITLRTAVANSCNTAFIGLRDRVPQAELARAAADLGLGGTAEPGFPAFLGAVPADATGTAHAASMIGQGQVQASPLAMATVAASVASGRTVVPWIVATAPPQTPADHLTDAETAALQDVLRAVVTEGGATFLADEPGAPVLAKTGTAQYEQDGETRNHAWMVAIQGDAAIAVFVADGDYGSTTAGPLLEQFLAATRP